MAREFQINIGYCCKYYWSAFLAGARTPFSSTGRLDWGCRHNAFESSRFDGKCLTP